MRSVALTPRVNVFGTHGVSMKPVKLRMVVEENSQLGGGHAVDFMCRASEGVAHVAAQSRARAAAQVTEGLERGIFGNGEQVELVRPSRSAPSTPRTAEVAMCRPFRVDVDDECVRVDEVALTFFLE